MTEPGIFWDDLNRDLQDPAVAAEFAENAARIQAYDAEVRAAFEDFEAGSLNGATVLTRRAWEGAVDTLDDEYFGAHMKPVRDAIDEAYGCFDYEQVAEFDRPLVRPGALFWLLSETVRRSDGHVEGRSQVRFRRKDCDDQEPA